MWTEAVARVVERAVGDMRAALVSVRLQSPGEPTPVIRVVRPQDLSDRGAVRDTVLAGQLTSRSLRPPIGADGERAFAALGQLGDAELVDALQAPGRRTVARVGEWSSRRGAARVGPLRS
jgi:hypothetical protein